jgi:hypothetical protein
MYPVFGNEPEYYEAAEDRILDFESYLRDNIFFDEHEVRDNPNTRDMYRLVLTPMCEQYCEDLSRIAYKAVNYKSCEPNEMLEEIVSTTGKIYRYLAMLNVFDRGDLSEVLIANQRFANAFGMYRGELRKSQEQNGLILSYQEA